MFSRAAKVFTLTALAAVASAEFSILSPGGDDLWWGEFGFFSEFLVVFFWDLELALGAFFLRVEFEIPRSVRGLGSGTRLFVLVVVLLFPSVLLLTVSFSVYVSVSCLPRGLVTPLPTHTHTGRRPRTATCNL